jgi:hypothetical protein
MTRTTNARIAGVTFLAYIAAGITSMVLSGRVAGGEGLTARLAAVANDATGVGLIVLLGLVQSFSALVLAVTLHALTREQDPDLALMGLACRLGEGLLGSLAVPGWLALLALATGGGGGAPDSPAAHVLAAYLLRGDMAFTATFFAVGSTLFCWLFLRGRMIPIPLAWLGVVASLLLVAVLPLQLAGFLRGPVTAFVWLPMLAFEVPLAAWLIFKGVAAPARG